MIYQLHHQSRDGSTDFVAQSVDFPADTTQEDFNRIIGEWKAGVFERHPLPEGCNWFMCTEDAPEFMKALPAVKGRWETVEFEGKVSNAPDTP